MAEKQKLHLIHTKNHLVIMLKLAFVIFIHALHASSEASIVWLIGQEYARQELTIKCLTLVLCLCTHVHSAQPVKPVIFLDRQTEPPSSIIKYTLVHACNTCKCTAKRSTTAFGLSSYKFSYTHTMISEQR